MKQKRFLFENTIESNKSAAIIIDKLFDYFSDCNSFIDIGCGLGGWTLEFEKRGLKDFMAVDHPKTPIEKLMFLNKQNFCPIDLEKHLPNTQKFDFGICIEVLEHFNEKRAKRILDFITDSTDLVLFSAAVPNQKGVGHINEQRHTYWHKIFESKGFNFYDGFKPGLYKFQNQIKFFHLQNLFIYYRNSHSNKFEGLHNITSNEFELVSTKILNKPSSLLELVKEIPLSLIRSLKYRISK
jgi:SAM-dependent methyltransferase